MQSSSSISSIVPSASKAANHDSKIEYSQEIRGTYLEWKNRAMQPSLWHNNHYEEAWKSIKEYSPFNDQMILYFIGLQTKDLLSQLFDKIKDKIEPTTQEDFSFFNPIFSDVADHYVTNASDSLMKCLHEKKSTNYEAILDIRLCFKNGDLKLEIEDNGAGIPFEIEQKIFSESVTTKTKETASHYGGGGIGLLNVSLLKDRLNGKAGFVNKGIDQGAKFWFEASLAKCKEVVQTPSYQKHKKSQYDFQGC